MTKKLKKQILRVGIGAFLFLSAVLVSRFVNEIAGLIIMAASYLIIGWNVIKSAAVNIAHGHVFDENFLMIVATIGAIICKEYDEAVAVMLFYQVGECFQSYAVNKSRKSIRALMEIRPDFARVIRDGEEKEIDPSEVEIGDFIIIKPGERIPLDGEVTEGASSIDTAAITGESLPSDVGIGDKVVSGCVNISGVLTVKVNATFSESTVSKVLTLVEEASSRKAKAEQFITVFSRVYTPVVVSAAVVLAVTGSLIFGEVLTWLYRAATFLLISCPCALVISIPLSFFGGIGGAGKQGILIKGGNFMDTLSKIDTLIMDKTGTITKGNFAISEIETTPAFKEEYKEESDAKLLEIAAYLESYSTHPIALSIVSRYGKEIDKNKLSEVSEIAGKGVKALYLGEEYFVGNAKLMESVLPESEIGKIQSCGRKESFGTVVYVAGKDRLAGHLHIEDEIKEDAIEALKLAKKNGIKQIVMLTGDNEATAKSVAGKVGIDRYFANLSPVDKVTAIEEIMAEKESGKVAFVGDGINDAPVLSRADIGIAMGAMGSDAAIEAADVVIMTDELSKIAMAKKTAIRTLRIVKENIVFALSVKLLVLILAAFGIAHMGAAIFSDVGVAFLAIMNATRALKQR